MKKRVRMADIAEKLGISVVTVSKALTGKSGVSEELRARVIALAQQMGYDGVKVWSKPLSDSNIGVLVSDRFFSKSTFYTNLYRALLLAGGKDLPICVLEIVTEKAERNAVLPNLVVGKKVDGIIFMGDLDEAYLQTVADTGVPCLLLDSYAANGHWNSVVSDNANGGYALTQHLLSIGRRKIGFIGNISSASCTMERYLGYQRALRTAGIVPREDWLLEMSGKAGALLAIDMPDTLPQAFVCGCDEDAYTLVEILQGKGLRIPEDVAVCGYGDIHLSSLSRPQITTYHVNIERMAALSLDLMARKLQGERIESFAHVIPGRLVIRESSEVKISD